MIITRALLRDSAIYGGSDFLSKVVMFFAFPLIAAAFDPITFGAFELFLTATALLGMVANFGLNNALQRYYWDSDTQISQRPVLVSSGLASQFFFLFISMLFGLIFVILYYQFGLEFLSPLTWVGMAAGLVVMISNQLVQYLLDVTRLHMAPWKFFGVAFVSRALTAIVGVIAVAWLGFSLDGLLVAQAVIMMAALPIALCAVRKDITSKVALSAALDLIKFGYPFIFAGLAFWLLSSIDRWMLVMMADVSEVGIYSVANRFSFVLLFISMAFGQAWSPVAIKIRSDNPDDYRRIYAEVFILLLGLMTIFGCVIAIFSDDFIEYVMPHAYHSASIPLAALSLGLIFQASIQVTSIGISIEKKTSLFAKATWFVVVLNFTFNYFLIPHLGATGAAVGTSISQFALSGLYLYFTQRLHPLPIPWSKLSILFFIWICSIILILLNYLYFVNYYIFIKFSFVFCALFLVFATSPSIAVFKKTI